jgi:hypothetical protein
MKLMKNYLIWILCVIITVSAAYYQRKTGPTHPEKSLITLNNSTYRLMLPRSHGGHEDKVIKLPVADTSITGSLVYRHYPTTEPWDTVAFTRTAATLTASLPVQPPAGKLEYFIFLSSGGRQYPVNPDKPVIIRFKGEVPAAVLIPHILLVFAAMLFSNVTGILALLRKPRYKLFGIITLVLLIAGGLIFGPIIQKYAFGAFWTGFPFGKDLTDNKILFAFIAWIIAVSGNIGKDRSYLSWIAAILYLLINFIPHSLFGSELDYQSGQVVTGLILLHL